MAFLEKARASFVNFGLWSKHHRSEILLAALFAVPFAWLAGWYLEHPDPFIIYVVADSDTNRETLQAFQEITNETNDGKDPMPKIGEVEVKVKLVVLPENTEEAATRVAADLSSRSDTLMVIGSGRSQLVEKSLPVYFTVHPRVPYLATTATDDDLLMDCGPECFEQGVLHSWFSSNRFAPLLQLSPTNKIQASSAIEFALENGRHRFLIITGNDTDNRSYELNLSREYEGAIAEASSDGAVEVNRYSIGHLSEAQSILPNMHPDCVLYVGNFGEAQTLYNWLQHSKLKNVMMILSDSVVQSRTSDAELSLSFRSSDNQTLLPVRFTHPTKAADYNRHVSTYDRDAFAIARALIEDLNDRGIDLSMRAKTLLHIHGVRDARRNLNRIMRQNAIVRTWYKGDTPNGEHPTIYIFKGHNQFNGIFHVWRLQGQDPDNMEDVDHWHPGRGITSAQESASLKPY